MKIGKKGNALTIVLIITALFAVMSYVILNFVQGRRGSSEEEIRFLQAKMIASDIVELGKYFLAYDRVVFMDDPLGMTAGRQAIQKDFSQQSYGSLVANNSFLLNACGGYDANAAEIGDFKADGQTVFCPYFVRNPLMDGVMFEDMMLSMWARSGAVGVLSMSGGVLETKSGTRTAIMTKDGSGAYSLTISLNEALKNPDNQFIRLHADQNILKMLKSGSFEAKLIFTFYSASAGFETISNERYVTIRSEVNYGTSLFKRSASASESLILYTSTVRDYAIFMMYPETSGGLKTRKFSEAMKLGGNTSRVNGRVFFNGDIDVPLTDLPVFNEIVVISGDLQVPPTVNFEQQRALMKEKFRKGLIVRFPVEKLINDGECVSGIPMSNQSGMYCKRTMVPTENFGISDYIINNGSACSNLKAKVNSGAYMYETAGSTLASAQEICKGSAPERLFLSGGVNDVEVVGSHAYIVSPVRNLKVQSAANIYGTIFGGYIEALAGSKFYSLSSLRKGLPGIASDVDLAAISGEGSRVQAGVGVPLLNLPLIKKPYLGK